MLSRHRGTTFALTVAGRSIPAYGLVRSIPVPPWLSFAGVGGAPPTTQAGPRLPEQGLSTVQAAPPA